MPTLSRQTLRSIVGCIAIAILFAGLARLGVALAAQGQRIAPVWLPNALLLGVLLRVRRDHAALLALSCLFSNIAVNVSLGVSLYYSGAFAAINIIEALTAAWAVRRLAGKRPDLADLRDLACFMGVAGVAAPLASGGAATIIMALRKGWHWQVWFDWSATDALGLLIGAPIVIALLDAARDRSGFSVRATVRGLAVLAFGLSGAGLVFAQNTYPLLFLVGPLALVTAFRMRTLGIALFVAGVAAIGTWATAAGHGPIALVQASLGIRLLILQLFFATIFALGLPVNAILQGLARTRAELHDAHEFADAILSNMREVIFRTDAQGRWVFLNPAWEAVTGYSVAQSLGWRTDRLLHPDDRLAARDIYPRIAGGEITDTILHQRFATASGEWRHIEVSVRTLWKDGSFDGTIGNIRDVTDSLRARQALRESERRFQTLADLAPVAIFRTDADGLTSYVNRAFTDWTGLTLDELSGDGWIRGVPEETRERLHAGWRDIVARRASWSGDYQYTRGDGTRSWVHTTSAPIIDDAGQLDGFIGIHVDIGERKAAEAELAEREAQLQLLARNATDAVFRIDLNGMCRYASPSVSELLGVAPDRLVGRPMLQRFHPDDEQGVRHAFGSLARGDSDRRLLHYRSGTIEGGWKWLEANCGLVRDPETGAPQEVIASIRDFTDRKTLELELTAARDAAQIAGQAKARFLAHMSHEIRTPMNGVLGFTELLLASDLTPDQRRQVRMLGESGRAMMRLLNDILDLSKIEAGQLSATSEPIDVRHAVGGCLQLMVPMTTQKALRFDCRFDDDVPALILGDDLRLRQVILNLLGNAVKFTANGMISVHARMLDPRTLAIAVRDTGIGIALDRLDAIFEPFAQGDAGTARHYGGTGLGLTISRQLAEIMGGALHVDSDPGHGSCFTLTLPAQAVALPRERDPSGDTMSGGIEPGHRVLLAEDHPVNQMLTRIMLERLGCRVTIAHDGREAVEAVEASDDDPFALVLMDVQMPGMDGLEAAARLRQGHGECARVPIIALTANAYPDDVAACLRSGMQGHLAKPVQLRQLADAVARWGATTAGSHVAAA